MKKIKILIVICLFIVICSSQNDSEDDTEGGSRKNTRMKILKNFMQGKSQDMSQISTMDKMNTLAVST